MKNNYYNRLKVACQNKQSHLCIGLDFDLELALMNFMLIRISMSSLALCLFPKFT